MGLQPLYYYHRNGVFIFGSNIPPIIAKLPEHPGYDRSQLVRLVQLKRSYSDKTFHRHIYRAEPGCITTISAKGRVNKRRFWQLDANAADIELPSDAAYLGRFSELMHESVAYNAQGEANRLCGKMSGGLDSGSIFITAQHQGLSYPLFMHTATEGGLLRDDMPVARAVVNHFGRQDIRCIGADQFDPIASFEYCAKVFAGPAPYILFMYMHHLYQAIQASGNSIVLSGAGGDDCVSGHAFSRFYNRSTYKQQGYGALWRALSQLDSGNRKSPYVFKRLLSLVRAAHPVLYQFFAKTTGVEWLIRQIINRQVEESLPCKAVRKQTVRQREWDLLQGPMSYSLRMRIEYNAVLGQAMGFEVRYPLLYPKLVEYCLRLPLNQKRRDGVGRYIMRQYLKQSGAPSALYGNLQKGGGIIPGALDKCYDWLRSGKFSQHFSGLPYMQYANTKTLHQELTQKTLMYMLKHVQ